MIELVVYVSLLALLSVGAMDLIINAYTVVAKARLQRTINTEGELVMQRMIREIRNARDIDAASSTFDASPGALRLIADGGAATTTVDFRIAGGVVHMDKATTSLDITSPDITVASLVFRNMSATSTPKAVRIELVLMATSSRFSLTSPLYGTAVVRGSYK